MDKDIDTNAPARVAELEARALARNPGGVGAALRALARFTFPGLEPPSGYATGYGRTCDGLGLYRGDRAALPSLARTGHAYRLGSGNRFWCITKRGRELARTLFGEDALAHEELVPLDPVDGNPPGGMLYQRKRLVEGKAVR